MELFMLFVGLERRKTNPILYFTAENAEVAELLNKNIYLFSSVLANSAVNGNERFG